MKNLAYILFAVFAAGAAMSAESMEADVEFFHPAASLYIRGDITSASNLVEKGLEIYPDDGKLLRLRELFKQPPQSQQDQGDQDQQDQNDQNNQEQQNPEQQEQENQQQQEQENQQQQEQESQDEQGQDGQEQPDDANQSSGDSQQTQQSQPEEEMSREEAMRVLNAKRQEEKNERMRLRPVLGTPVRVDKDW